MGGGIYVLYFTYMEEGFGIWARGKGLFVLKNHQEDEIGLFFFSFFFSFFPFHYLIFLFFFSFSEN